MTPRVREIVGGIVGFALFVVLSTLLFYLTGYNPHAAVSRSFEVISIIAGIMFAFAAGYCAAWISPAAPIRPALMIALLIAVSSIISMLTSFSAEAWSQLAALFLMAPAVVAGAHTRRNSARHRIHITDGAQ